MLNQAGDIFVWFPYDEMVKQAIEEHHLANKANKIFATPAHEIPCATWDLKQDSFKLPALANLPLLSISPESKDIKVVKIAAFDNSLIALTNHGHVVKFDGLANGMTAKTGQWTYLPKFSEAEKLKEHEVFSAAQEQGGSLRISETLQITHVRLFSQLFFYALMISQISAHFQKFVAYSTGPTSVVIMGDRDTNAQSTPKVIPELQNIGVISVALGDYHCGALTEAGKLLTWGQYSEGALGLGDPARISPGEGGGFRDEGNRQTALSRGTGRPLDVTVPTEVRFDHEVKGNRNMYCFAATASGWHMGALAIDLETHSEDDDDDDESSDHMPGHFDVAPSPQSSGGNVPVPGGYPSFSTRGFRVGFAGRGMMRGGPSQRGF
ncbi:hypothetical protein HWV62_27552 [Athelia sp. TMB]|nr:hypothetical protein HWV62_27552 [Athelia sp. TMB]